MGGQLGGLLDQARHERRAKTHQHDGRRYYGNQVNGPRLVAFTHKIDVSRAAFVSVNVNVHSSLRL
jgi:hypothetical protein